MHKYVMKRLLMLIPVILGVSFLVFFIMSLAPGDTARMILGDDAPIEAVEALREELGLNDPVMVRYAHYMLDLLHGDLGTSYKSSRPVFSEIAARFPATFRLSFWGMMFAVVLSIPIGIISATRQYSIADSVSMVLALLGVATPNFWLGLMLIIAFSLNLRWFPSGGGGRVEILGPSCDYFGHRLYGQHYQDNPLVHVGGHTPGLYPHGQGQRREP